MLSFNKDNDKIYFDQLPKGTQAIVKVLILEAAESRSGPEGYKPDDECIEELDCRRRDGFIPNRDNLGGLIYRNFSNLMDYYASGHLPMHVKAEEVIEQQVSYTFENIAEDIYNDYKDLFDKHELTKDDANYNTIQEIAETYPEFKEVLDEIEDYESNSLSCNESSIMHELRFMYHGKDAKGRHRASVSAAINTEAPYHRSNISWSPNTFCEGAKEIEITWTTQADLKVKLKKALAKCSKEIF